MKTFKQVMEVTGPVSGEASFSIAECRAYYDLLAALPQGATVLEIGLQFGRSSSIVGQLQQEKQFNYVGIDPFIDPPEARWGWLNLMGDLGVKYQFHSKYSKDVDLSGYAVDLTLIDGDHTEDGWRTDLRLTMPQTKRGGYILLHDYGEAPLPNVYPHVHAPMVRGVMQGWEELPTVDTLGIWRKP